ncbi:hypothetical protein OIC43_43165 [Streptomyces sp. NBC_00825]|uniref:hypothetical protein n=1 Tax=unclassified Streptomyces TaxID=2593676 RepID=UPI002257C12D|nr:MULTISPECIES: hypothetical protein [unclassified Streptomyces]WTB51800.1 hypothetical protein OG832_00515 [Streptomyces sp. NBC_00826]WTH95308.1 hypothetical protein OIC43_43165 [Streptomyces sp. NBC_00825]WTI04042.1 hypothetical protein OHA23_43140 [Streptomyces sp. NBC_00822]MCX4869639.1 hypothetical protein [Streptomyces sp. NBC_00906]MCX4900878.1 hypothetical protein [Streptomyces sp. NBC_00892]
MNSSVYRLLRLLLLPTWHYFLWNLTSQSPGVQHQGEASFGAYTEDPDTGAIRGLIYAPFAQYVLDVHPLGVEVHPNLTVPGLLGLLDVGRMVMASVHKEIRRPENPAHGKGGHLVLVTGRQGDTVHFRNPSGHTKQARTASLPAAEFAEFFGGRGVSLT